MATLTRRVIQALESDPDLYRLALGEAVELMRQEQRAADRLEQTLAGAGFPEDGGWVDWPEVLEYFRERATAEYMRDEMRRNARIQLKPPREAD